MNNYGFWCHLVDEGSHRVSGRPPTPFDAGRWEQLIIKKGPGRIWRRRIINLAKLANWKRNATQRIPEVSQGATKIHQKDRTEKR